MSQRKKTSGNSGSKNSGKGAKAYSSKTVKGGKSKTSGDKERGAKLGGSSGSSNRMMHTKVKTARGRKLSSTLWLHRQLNDPYVKQAKAEGYASRAAYKIKEMDDRYNFLKRGKRIIDLGAAPGGWTQVCVERTGSTPEEISVVGIDYLQMMEVPGATILMKDFLDDDAPEALLSALGNHKPDVVLSDMASPTTGHRRTDHIRTMHLVEVALDFALKVLKPGGHFLCKTFQGGTEAELLKLLKDNFQEVHHVKPPASREGSVELYLFARNFKNKPLNKDDDQDGENTGLYDPRQN